MVERERGRGRDVYTTGDNGFCGGSVSVKHKLCSKQIRTRNTTWPGSVYINSSPYSPTLLSKPIATEQSLKHRQFRGK